MELAGSQVMLRPGQSADIDALVAIFASPEVAAWWVGYDRARIEAEVLHKEDPNSTVYVIDVDGEVAGIVQSHEEPEEEYRSAGIDIAVGPGWHGTGVALDALRTLARHLIEDRGHHHLTIDPAAANTRAILQARLPAGGHPPPERARLRRHLPRHPAHGPGEG